MCGWTHTQLLGYVYIQRSKEPTSQKWLIVINTSLFNKKTWEKDINDNLFPPAWSCDYIKILVDTHESSGCLYISSLIQIFLLPLHSITPLANQPEGWVPFCFLPLIFYLQTKHSETYLHNFQNLLLSDIPHQNIWRLGVVVIVSRVCVLVQYLPYLNHDRDS
jgi:hypothetical protein